MNDSRRLTIMMKVADVARADLALTPERVYYRFATDESIEDGELPAIKEDFDLLSERLLHAAEAQDNERPLDDRVKLSLFVTNRLCNLNYSEQSLGRLVGELSLLADEFSFLKGFV